MRKILLGCVLSVVSVFVSVGLAWAIDFEQIPTRNLHVTWIEPSVNNDGSPLTDLAKVVVQLTVDGVAQVALQLVAFRDARVHLFHKELVAVAVVFFGAVHGEGGAVDLREVTVLDGAGHPLRDVACHPLTASDHPRRLLDPIDHRGHAEIAFAPLPIRNDASKFPSRISHAERIRRRTPRDHHPHVVHRPQTRRGGESRRPGSMNPARAAICLRSNA